MRKYSPREAKALSAKLAEADRKRSRYQDMAAEGLISFDELREKILALENARETAERDLEALKNERKRILELDTGPRCSPQHAHADRIGGAGSFVAR